MPSELIESINSQDSHPLVSIFEAFSCLKEMPLFSLKGFFQRYFLRYNNMNGWVCMVVSVCFAWLRHFSSLFYHVIKSRLDFDVYTHQYSWLCFSQEESEFIRKGRTQEVRKMQEHLK